MILKQISRVKELLLYILISTLPISAYNQVTDTIVQLPEVIITDSALQKNIPVIHLEKRSIDLNISPDLGSILRRESNVSGIRRGGYAIDPVVRGYRYSQIRVILDEGIHIEGGCPNRMDPVLSHLNPDVVKRLEIIKGSYMMQYGPSALAGIRVISRPGWQDFNKGFNAQSNVSYDAGRNGYRQYIGMSGSNKKMLINVSGGIAKAGNYKDGNGTEWKSSYTKKDISADAGYKLGKNSMLVISYKGSFTDDVLFPALPMDEISDNTHIISGYYSHFSPRRLNQRLELSIWHTRVNHLMDNSKRPQYSHVVPPYQGIMQATALVNTSSIGGRIAIARTIGNFSLSNGIDLLRISKDGTRNMRMIMIMDGQEFISSKSFNLWNDAMLLNSGLFSELKYNKGKFQAGGVLRIDYYKSHSADTLILIKENQSWFNSSPVEHVLLGAVLNASYSMREHSSLGLGIAFSQRAPDMQERYIKFLATGFDKYDYLGNPQLRPETSLQADIIANHQFKDVSLQLNLFASQIKDYITGMLISPSVAMPVSMGAPGVKQFTNVDRAFFTGFEAGGGMKVLENGMLTLSAGYTYAWFPSVVKNLIQNGQVIGSTIIYNDPLPEIPALDAEVQFSYDFTGIKLMPSVSFRAVSEQAMVSESNYEEKTPGYFLTDMSVSYAPCKYATLTAGSNNLFDVAYFDHLNRRMLGSDYKLYEPGRSFYLMMKLNF